MNLLAKKHIFMIALQTSQGEKLNVSKDLKLKIEFNNPFFNTEYVEGSFAYPFKIPNSPKNFKNFQSPNIIETPYLVPNISLNVIVNDINWLNGSFRTTKATPQDIEGSLSLDYGTFAQAIDDEKSLKDVDFGQYVFGQGEINGENAYYLEIINPLIPTPDSNLGDEYEIQWKKGNTIEVAVRYPTTEDVFQIFVDELNNNSPYNLEIQGSNLKFTHKNNELDPTQVYTYVVRKWREDDFGVPFVVFTSPWEATNIITNQELSPNYQYNNFTFPKIKSQNFYDTNNQKNTQFLGYVNNWNGTIFPMNQQDDNKYTLVPYLKLKFILGKIFEFAGYTAEGNFWANTELSELVIYNTYSLDRQHPNIQESIKKYNVYADRIIYANHLPNISIKSFINAIQKLFCVQIGFDNQNKKVTLNLRKNTLLSSNLVNWGHKMQILEVEFDEKASYILQYAQGQTEIGFFNSLKIGSQTKIEKVEFQVGSLRFDAYNYAIDDRKGNSTMFGLGTDNDFPFKLLFWRGLQGGIPTATAQAFGSYQYTLQIDTEKGIYNNFWKEYISFLQTCKYVPQKKVYLSIIELKNFDINKKVVINHNHYIIKKLSIDIDNSNDSITKPATVELVKIPIL